MPVRSAAARMKIALALALIRLLSWLPLRLVYGLAVIPGGLAYLLPWRKHRVIETNLDIAFPELNAAQRRRLHRQNLVEMMRLVLESGAAWYWSARRLERHLASPIGWDEVEKARREGRGVLLIGAHLGNWELSSLVTSLKGPFCGLYKPPRDAAVDEALTRSRERFTGRLIATGSPAMRGLLRELKSGGTVGLLMDQLPRQGEGVYAPLFGRPALTLTLVNRLARRTGCQVFFVTVERLSMGRGWQLRCAPVPATVGSADSVAAAGAINAQLEAAIRRVPAQYLWLYKRFALPPEGYDDPYKKAA
ncbi:MAG: hypothetical protein EA419_04205 [Wenzhouxiangella sp.]|nr:MAG: hypothetical protein EA419_04205 [Wenzhouxiangella sp.]